MNILVTGGAGFIASQVVDRYIAEKHCVTILDNLVTGFKQNIHPEARFIEKDLCDPSLRENFKELQFDLVNHHAAQIDVRASLLNPMYDANVNIKGTLQLLEHMRATGVSKIIYASTGGAIYGDPIELPLTEQSIARPLCPYAVSKFTGEQYIQLYQRLYDFQYTILRYPNIYGPRQNPEGEAGVNAIFIGIMMKGETPTIYGDGEQLRDYIFVSDIVEVNTLALDRMENQIFNIATGLGSSVNAIYEILQNEIPYTSEAYYVEKRLGEIEKTFMSPAKIKEHWGWEPQYTLEQGLKKMVAWFRDEGFERFFSKKGTA